jgi:hypothetical protein
MPHHDLIDWWLGAATVFGAVAFVAACPPGGHRHTAATATSESLRTIRRAFIALGLLLAAGTAVVLANAPAGAPPPPRTSVDSVRYLTDSAGTQWHLQALGATAWRGGDTVTSHWAIRRLMHLDCHAAAGLRRDGRYREQLAHDSAARRMVSRGCAE